MLAALSLRSKIGGIFSAMAIIVALGGWSMLWYTHQIDTMLVSMVNKDFVLYKTAQDMELALANQKGLLTYYLVDGDAKWLKSLGEYRQVFYQIIEEAQRLELTAQQRKALQVIADKYQLYAKAKDIAIDNYQRESFLGSISGLHEHQREAFFGVLGLCRAFSEDQLRVIIRTKERSNVLSQTCVRWPLLP